MLESVSSSGSPVENKKLGVALIDAIMNGNIDLALNLVKNRFPQVIDRINQHQLDVVVDSRMKEDMIEEIL